MDTDGIFKKGTQFAEQAVAADQAHNYDKAVEAYIAAAQCLMHVNKYTKLERSLKENLYNTAKNYLQRAEDIKNMNDKQINKSDDKKLIKSNVPETQANKSDDLEKSDPETLDMMKRFESAIIENPGITFDDIIGLEQAKVALEEAVILPVQYPKLFRGNRRPWTGILLYGPPGTGKSFLAKAIASECKTTFISASVADILSKYVGESEKSVRALFQLARKRKPCIIFIDEVDAVCGQRNDKEADVSRRVTNEFLGQMDGVGKENSGVLVLAATNLPWTLDTAIRRRFEKRIYIPLPDVNERADLFKKKLGTDAYHTIKEDEWMKLAQKAENYSGADIGVVCREALFRPVRRMNTATHFKRIPNPAPDGPREIWSACSPGDPEAQLMKLRQIHPDEVCEPPVTKLDMFAALETQRPTVSEKDLVKYQEFTREFGEDGR